MQLRSHFSTTSWASATLAVFYSALMSACGGGGSAETAPLPPVSSYPVNAVLTKLAERGGTFSAKYTDPDGKPQTLSVRYVPSAAGHMAREEDWTPSDGQVFSTRNEWVLSTTSPTLLFTQWTNLKIRSIDASMRNTAIPAMAARGSSGALIGSKVASMTSGQELADPYGVSTLWALDAVSDHQANLCLEISEGRTVMTVSVLDCFRIDGAGTIQGFKSIKRGHFQGVDNDRVFE